MKRTIESVTTWRDTFGPEQPENGSMIRVWIEGFGEDTRRFHGNWGEHETHWRPLAFSPTEQARLREQTRFVEEAKSLALHKKIEGAVSRGYCGVKKDGDPEWAHELGLRLGRAELRHKGEG